MLVAMDIGITLTVVETKRTFRNDEQAAIEALLSLPVPVHAAFFGLKAKIDGRILKGIAQAREEARETYEEAVSRGLHAWTAQLRETDRISLWEFDSTCNPVDRGLAAAPGEFAQAIEKLTPPRGGTEIGNTLHATLQGWWTKRARYRKDYP